MLCTFLFGNYRKLSVLLNENSLANLNEDSHNHCWTKVSDENKMTVLQCMELTGSAKFQDMMVLFRNTMAPDSVPVIEDTWIDIKYRDPFPANKNPIPAANRKVKNDDGTEMFQYVALWYKHGEPVFGRAYPDCSDKVLASFGYNGQENAGAEIGSFQMVIAPPNVSSLFRRSFFSL